MVIVDGHVHIHPCFELDRFFEGSYSNLRAAAAARQAKSGFSGFLMLAESRGVDRFSELREMAKGRNSIGQRGGKWAPAETGEDRCLKIHLPGRGHFFLISGRQVVTEEKLEVIALFCDEKIEDGQAIQEVLQRIGSMGGLAVVPWGFGKWRGDRGRVLRQVLEESEPPAFFLGDNSGRPAFRAEPELFRLARQRGVKILPGSDPLPFPREDSRAGSFGCRFEAEVSKSSPASDLRNLLISPSVVLNPYGKLENPYVFLRNQVKMQLWKRGWIKR